MVGAPGPRDAAPSCKNLQCQQTKCAVGTTTITGTTFAPNGTLPLYNVLVYIPNSPLPKATEGLTCDRCGRVPAGGPVASAVSDSHGQFKLENAPVGKNIPLVIQVGKWRRLVTIPEIKACEENKLTDPDQTRLPKSRAEGDMPRIAVTTGDCDNLVCLMPKIGIDLGEWGIEGEDKAVTFYRGGTVDTGLAQYPVSIARKMTAASNLWGNLGELEKHDMSVFSCECKETQENKGPAAYKAITDYLAKGGRIFGTDYQYVWHKYSPDVSWSNLSSIPGGAPIGSNPLAIDTSFPKGKALADWFKFIEPTSTYGKVDCAVVLDNFSAVSQPAGQVWARSPGHDPAIVHPRILTVNTPAGLPADQQCGKAVHIDAHITGRPEQTRWAFPDDCGPQLTGGEKALAFFFFDLASCIQEDTLPPEPPPIIN